MSLERKDAFFGFVQKCYFFLVRAEIQGGFFTGSAQKVLSMELVPPNSKKTTKYTGSAQYTKNG